MLNFKILAQDNPSTSSGSKARVGRITTDHGIVGTPAFVPVGTQATVKSLTPQDLKEIGVQIFFGNTYHLHLRPGEDVIKDFGGLGKFMGWSGATMTDSGGFQVFSLAKSAPALRSPRQFDDFSTPPFNASLNVARAGFSQKTSLNSSFKNSSHAEAPRALSPDVDKEAPKLVTITDNGVTFRSHIDGSLHEFTPEKSIQIQKKLGADIILAFDQCVPYPSSHQYAKQAMERTHKWGLRSLECFNDIYHLSGEKRKQSLYGIIQGGVYRDLREKSARFISSLPFDGIAIGGVAVGESKKEMMDVLDWIMPILPGEKPRHLLGVGEIDDIFKTIERGIDMFDCVLPTRLGRTGFILISPPEGNVKKRFRIDIAKSKFAKDKRPLCKDCDCFVCQQFTRGYIHHLFRVKELLAYRLASYHNLYFVTNLVSKIRNAILDGRFNRFRKEWLR